MEEYVILYSALQKGYYVIVLDVHRINSGMYLCDFKTEDFSKSEKCAIVK
jgi:hypothetical protein